MTQSITRKIGFTLFAAISFVAASSASHAYTAEQQRLCTGDAFRLCSSEIPNIAGVTACMRKNKAKLSTGCLAVFDKEPKASKIAAVNAE